jgi:hypothetical protein
MSTAAPILLIRETPQAGSRSRKTGAGVSPLKAASAGRCSEQDQGAATALDTADVPPLSGRAAWTPLPPCFLENPSLPSTHTEDEWSYIEDQVDEELSWCPDQPHPEDVCLEDSILLERRGLTPQTTPKPHLKPFRTFQVYFWQQQTVHKNSIAAKLREAGMSAEAAKLENCHSTWTVAICGDCGAVRKFPNRCDLFFCPECQSTIGHHRKKQVEWWTRLVVQPKHLVLTVKNVRNLTAGHVAEFRSWFTKLRRRKFCRNWKGGFYSIECTNEGSGWHLHLHALVEAKWIDQAQLSKEWSSATKGFGRIVKVKDVREGSYLAELTKYVAKGSDLAKWSTPDISTFVRAFANARTFGVFGSLYGARTKFAEFVASIREHRPKCDCGSCNVRYLSEADFLLLELRPPVQASPAPPPDLQLRFLQPSAAQLLPR